MVRRLLLAGTGAKQNIPTEPGAYIAFHLEDGRRSAVKAEEWLAIEAKGYVADGILCIQEGYAPVIFAPTQKSMNFYFVNTSTPSAWASNLPSGCDDTDVECGKENTISLNNQLTAFGYCAVYEYGNIGRGKWWLPSCVEAQIGATNYEELVECWQLLNNGNTPNPNIATSVVTNYGTYVCYLAQSGRLVKATSVTAKNYVVPTTSFEDIN